MCPFMSAFGGQLGGTAADDATGAEDWNIVKSGIMRAYYQVSILLNLSQSYESGTF